MEQGAVLIIWKNRMREEKMKKGQIYEGTIEKVLFPNKGQIEAEGRTVTVKNGLPGQIVRYQVTKVRKGKAEGRVVEVVKREIGRAHV